MNKHILLVMKWLDDNSSVTKEELINNNNAAYAVYAAADAYAVSAYAAAAYADAAAADAADADSVYTEKWVKKYFERTGEDKQLYIDEIEKGKSKPVTQLYTQKMVDDGVLPLVGMECEWKHHSTNIVLTFIGDEMFCGKNDSGKESAGYVGDLKPLPVPIELVGGRAYQFDFEDGSLCGIYNNYSDVFRTKNADIEIGRCKNFQPLTLTPEVKS